MSPMRAFDTPRLHVRPLAECDEALYCSLYTDPKVMRYIATPVSLEAAQRSFRAACRLQSPWPQRWIVSERGTCDDIGMLAFFADGDAAEIGVMLLADRQGRGYASEAIAALVDRVFNTPVLDRPALLRLWARHTPDNKSMSSLMEGLGFQREAMGSTADVEVRWQITRDRWQARHARCVSLAMSPGDR